MATYWLKIANFPYPFLISPPAQNDPFEFTVNLTDPETKVFQAVECKDLVILACTVFD